VRSDSVRHARATPRAREPLIRRIARSAMLSPPRGVFRTWMIEVWGTWCPLKVSSTVLDAGRGQADSVRVDGLAVGGVHEEGDGFLCSGVVGGDTDDVDETPSGHERGLPANGASIICFGGDEEEIRRVGVAAAGYTGGDRARAA